VGRTALALGIFLTVVAGESSGQTPAPAAGAANKPGELVLNLGDHRTLKVVQIPAGDFVMGSPESEKGHTANEAPQRRVRITQSFYLGVTEVTQEQYAAVMTNNPSKARGTNLPVEMVSWEEAMAFCRKLSQMTGRTVRLPTEAEWEYACRAGSPTPFSFGSDDEELGFYAWFSSNSGGKTHPVGQKQPNAFGLHDMHGNVWEWCSDWYQDSYKGHGEENPAGPKQGSLRVLRGGFWGDAPRHCRSAHRGWFAPGSRNGNGGFRVAVSAAGVDPPHP
jgi:formylglycine-generating enzyme required for sulfatase activity